jgi:hypothetical protein
MLPPYPPRQPVSVRVCTEAVLPPSMCPSCALRRDVRISIVADPGFLGEPFVKSPTKRTERAAEEHRRRAETPSVRRHAGRNRLPGIRAFNHYGTHRRPPCAFLILLFVEMPRSHGAPSGISHRNQTYLERASACDTPAAIGFAASAATFQYSAHNSPVRLDIALSCRGACVVQTSITSGNDFAAMSSRQQS